MPNVYMLLARGFEECEALAPLDILRRGGITVKTVGIGNQFITGAHGITVKADSEEKDVVLDDELEAVSEQFGDMLGDMDGFQPGGAGTMPFLQNLFNSEGAKSPKKDEDAEIDSYEQIDLTDETNKVL